MTRFFSLILGCAAALLLSGCGSKMSPVSGTVNLDGKPVAGATIIFTSDSGGVVASGLTDDSGRYTLSYLNAPKVPAGSYKVSVLKTKIIEGQAPVMDDPGSSKAYEAKMKKEMPKAGAITGPQAKTGETKVDTQLPAVYASAATTPVTAQVPAPNDTVNVDLKSKP